MGKVLLGASIVFQVSQVDEWDTVQAGVDIRDTLVVVICFSDVAVSEASEVTEEDDEDE